MGRLGDLFKSIDLYGESIGFEIGGESSFTSYLGAFVTLIILVITFSYAIQCFETMRFYQDTTHLSSLDISINAEKVFE